MANTDAAVGLRPHNKLGSNANSSGTTAYKVQIAGTAGSSSAIYQGDMVIPLTNGLVDVSAADGGSVAILGVMNGCQYTNLSGETVFSNYYPGTASLKSGTEATVFVYDDPFGVFEVNCDASLTNLATATALIHSNAGVLHLALKLGQLVFQQENLLFPLLELLLPETILGSLVLKTSLKLLMIVQEL